MNVFFVIDGKVVTPKLNGTILEGGTRSMAIELLKKSGYAVQERLVSIDELRASYDTGTLTESFGTGTAAVITPIRDLTSETFTIDFNSSNPEGMGPVAAQLYEQITAIQTGRDKDTHKWLHFI